MFYGMTKKYWNENNRKNGKLATSSNELASVFEVEVLASFHFTKWLPTAELARWLADRLANLPTK